MGFRMSVPDPSDARRRAIGLSICAAVPLTWLALAGLLTATAHQPSTDPAFGPEPMATGTALAIGAGAVILFTMGLASLYSLRSRPGLTQEEAADLIARTEDDLDYRMPFAWLRRIALRSCSILGFPFAFGGVALLLAAYEVEEGAVFDALLGLIVASFALAVFVGVTSYPTFLLSGTQRVKFSRGATGAIQSADAVALDD